MEKSRLGRLKGETTMGIDKEWTNGSGVYDPFIFLEDVPGGTYESFNEPRDKNEDRPKYEPEGSEKEEGESIHL
jgi:hypothetical protein